MWLKGISDKPGITCVIIMHACIQDILLSQRISFGCRGNE